MVDHIKNHESRTKSQEPRIKNQESHDIDSRHVSEMGAVQEQQAEINEVPYYTIHTIRCEHITNSYALREFRQLHFIFLAKSYSIDLEVFCKRQQCRSTDELESLIIYTAGLYSRLVS